MAEEPGEPTVQIKHAKFIPLINVLNCSSSGNNFAVQQEHQATCTRFNVTTNSNPDLPLEVPISPTSRCNGLKEERNGCLRRNADTTVKQNLKTNWNFYLFQLYTFRRFVTN